MTASFVTVLLSSVVALSRLWIRNTRRSVLTTGAGTGAACCTWAAVMVTTGAATGLTVATGVGLGWTGAVALAAFFASAAAFSAVFTSAAVCASCHLWSGTNQLCVSLSHLPPKTLKSPLRGKVLVPFTCTRGLSPLMLRLWARSSLALRS